MTITLTLLLPVATAALLLCIPKNKTAELRMTALFGSLAGGGGACCFFCAAAAAFAIVDFAAICAYSFCATRCAFRSAVPFFPPFLGFLLS